MNLTPACMLFPSALGAAQPCSLRRRLPRPATNPLPRIFAARHAVQDGSRVHPRHNQRGCTAASAQAVCIAAHRRSPCVPERPAYLRRG